LERQPLTGWRRLKPRNPKLNIKLLVRPAQESMNELGAGYIDLVIEDLGARIGNRGSKRGYVKENSLLIAKHNRAKRHPKRSGAWRNRRCSNGNAIFNI
jgi:hypothetical protein